MYAAQEMFKTANKVTRPEKALILGFMAGSRGMKGLVHFQHHCNEVDNNPGLTSSYSCREPMSGAGRHHPDQAERAHGGFAQSRWHGEHNHAGGHSFRNELLHRTVDSSEEIQTHHQLLLSCSHQCLHHPQKTKEKKTNIGTDREEEGEKTHCGGERSFLLLLHLLTAGL